MRRLFSLGGAQSAEDRPAAGAAIVVGAMALLALVDNLVPFVSSAVNVWQFHAIRAVAAGLLIACGLLVWRNALRRPKRWIWVGARGLLLAGAMVLFFAALPLMPIAQAAAGLFTSPFWVLLFETAFFGAPLRGARVLAAAVGFAGAALILDVFARAPDWTALLPIAAGAGYGLSLIVTRRFCRDEAPATLALASYAAFFALGVLGWAALAAWPVDPALASAAPFLLGAPQAALSAETLGWIALLALGSVTSLIALARAYQIADPGFLAAFDYAYIPVAAAVAYLLWGDAPAPSTGFGALLIVTAGVMLARSEARRPRLAAGAG